MKLVKNFLVLQLLIFSIDVFPSFGQEGSVSDGLVLGICTVGVSLATLYVKNSNQQVQEMLTNGNFDYRYGGGIDCSTSVTKKNVISELGPTELILMRNLKKIDPKRGGINEFEDINYGIVGSIKEDLDTLEQANNRLYSLSFMSSESRLLQKKIDRYGNLAVRYERFFSETHQYFIRAHAVMNHHRSLLSMHDKNSLKQGFGNYEIEPEVIQEIKSMTFDITDCFENFSSDTPCINYVRQVDIDIKMLKKIVSKSYFKMKQDYPATFARINQTLKENDGVHCLLQSRLTIANSKTYLREQETLKQSNEKDLLAKRSHEGYGTFKCDSI